ncbi:MAG: divalent metal cation transporter [Terracidiphilus sp.]
MRLAETQLNAVAAPTEAAALKGVAVRSSWQKHVLTFLMVFGPSLIVMEADNDAGAVSTYMQAGGQYGPHVLWTLIVLLPICDFVQEKVARLGIATGKGPAVMIYERLGMEVWGTLGRY